MEWKRFMGDYRHIMKAWAFLNWESKPVSESRGNTLVDWGFDFDVVDPDAYRFKLEWTNRDTPIRDIRIEFVDYYEAPGKHLGSVEWKVD